MATIKDVARLAGVSHGTVSNVINGVKTVNSQTAARVEQAMRELGYQPDAKARSLRSSRTGTIGVVLPNMADRMYSRLYAGLAEPLQTKGYSLSLFLTDDCAERETAALQSLQRQRAEAVLAVSCIPDSVELFDSLIAQGTKLLFLQRRPAVTYRGVFAALDFEELFFQGTKKLLSMGITQLRLLTGNQQFSCEQCAQKGFRRALEEAKIAYQKEFVRVAGGSKESAFREAVWWLQSSQAPQAVLATCQQHALGIEAAIKLFEGKKESCIRVFSPVNEDWVRKEGGILSCGLERLGKFAAQKVMQQISGRGANCSETQILPALPQPRRFTGGLLKRGGALRLTLLEGAASYALRLMLPRFTKSTGIEVETEILPYEEIRDSAESGGFKNTCDLLQASLAWFSRLSKKQAFLPLPASLLERFPQALLKTMQAEVCCGMPFMQDGQILFYRKDLFESPQFQRLYYERFRTDLKVPETWAEFRQTAEFFTRRETIESPVAYGTTMGGAPAHSIYSFLPALWEKGADLFSRDGRFITQNNAVTEALQRYRELFSYADPQAVNWGWAEQTQAFVKGEAAMMPLYQAHYMDYLSRETTAVGGKLGTARLPGNASVLGGWVLAIPAASPQQSAALLFLDWLSSAENAVPYNVLGGSLPTNEVLQSSDLQKAYPWFFCALASFSNSRLMVTENAEIGQPVLEKALGPQLHDFLLGRLTAEEVLTETAKRM